MNAFTERDGMRTCFFPLSNSLSFKLPLAELLSRALTEKNRRFRISSGYDIALQEVPGGVQAAHTAKRPISAGLYHTAFEVNTAREMLGVVHRLEAGAVQFSLVNHRISWALYTDDPSGNGVEVYLDRRTSATCSRVWGGASEHLSVSAIADAAASEH